MSYITGDINYRVSLSLCFLILPELVVFFAFHFPDDFGLTSFEEAFLKRLVILTNRELVHLPWRTRGYCILLPGRHKPWRAAAGAPFAVQGVDFHFIPCFHPAPSSALTGTCLEQSLLRIRLSFPWPCWGRDGGKVEGTSRGGTKSSLCLFSLQPTLLLIPSLPRSTLSKVWVPAALSLTGPRRKLICFLRVRTLNCGPTGEAPAHVPSLQEGDPGLLARLCAQCSATLIALIYSSRELGGKGDKHMWSNQPCFKETILFFFF